MTGADGQDGATRRPLGPLKALVYATLAASLVLALIEGLAALAEPHLFPYKRSLPIASPGAPGTEAFTEEAAQQRAHLDPSALPSAGHTGIPLAADAQRGWSLPPNSEVQVSGVVIRGNSLGMRGSDLTPPVPGEVRLFTLGDSSIFGDGVDEVDVFSTVSAGMLARAWDRRVLGVIGAVPGHDSGQSLNTLKGLGERVRPTWVIVGNLWSDLYRREDPSTDPYVYLPPVKGILRKSALYRLMWRGMSPWLNATQVRWIEDQEDVGDVEDETLRVPLRDYLRNLSEMAEVTRRLGARIAFLILPAPMDFDAVPVPDAVSQYRLGMKRVAAREGAPLLDGPALFKDRGGGPALFWDNVHPTAEGHFLLGTGLSELLEPFGPPPAGRSQYAAQDDSAAGARSGGGE